MKPAEEIIVVNPPPLAQSWRWIVSAGILLQLLAVFIPPWSMQPAARLTSFPRRWLQPYVDVAYLDHGYRFFAPDPGEESHLVRYDLKYADGRMEKGLTFPDRAQHWPRLLYHRHFMLTEFLNTISPPPSVEAPPVENIAARADYDRSRKMYDGLCEGYAQHLLHTSDADEVTLYRRRHLIPSPPEVLNGKKLDDADSYKDDLLGLWKKAE